MNIQNTYIDAQILANAIQRGESSIVLTSDDQNLSVTLPAPQIYGTGTQCRTYAIESAKQILDLANSTFKK